MADPDSTPPDLDAWLAGELDQDARLAFEAGLNPPETPGESDLPSAILLEELARESSPPAGPISQLIEFLKTQSGEPLPAPSPESWMEILSPPSQPDHLGILGEYEIIEVIETGGMGVVFRARDPNLHRIVALKALARALAANTTACERFLHEARSAAKLEHENILPIYSVHEENGIPCFAMRFAAGGSLQDALDRGEEFDLPRLKSIAIQVAAALGTAHHKGIIHRDIKPGNILFDEDGETVWVCDFGIARSTENPQLAYAGTVAGTPRYMSPEQADGRELDGRSDLFSLGAVLYHCATGEPPFRGETTTAVLKQLADSVPTTATRINPGLPAWFDQLLSALATPPR